MFEISSAEEPQPRLEIKEVKPEDSAKLASSKKSRPKSKVRTFTDLQRLVSEWRPSNPRAPRRMLSSEIMHMLELNSYSYIKACIPSIIVDGQYPIDLMHYRSEQDIYEFMTRMMWMHQEYGKALGIMIGADDDGVAAQIDDACGSLLPSDRDCVVILL
jgi:hypothetical protein